MSFFTIEFCIFLLFTMVAYFIFPLKYRWYVLLISSLAFYLVAGVEMLPYLLLMTMVAYVAGLKMEDTANCVEEKSLSKIEAKKRNRLILSIAFVIVIGGLVVVKVAKWIPESWGISIIMPLGISYYVFSIIAYLADIYWKRCKAEKNFLKLLLFVSYFPKILQGPIERYQNLMPKLIEGHKFSMDRLCYGLQLCLWGTFKKLVMADRMGIFTAYVFGNYEKCSGSIIVIATMLAAVQVYCDFSGCMDIVGGISQIVGVDLEKNFNHPFFSKTVSEFWRRWHITLGAWFKDYVYMPLTISKFVKKTVRYFKSKFGNKAGKNVLQIITLSVVWFLTGLWHGTGMPYIAWGVYWGTLIILSAIFEDRIRLLNQKLGINVQTKKWQLFQCVRTFLLFSLGRLITVPGNLGVSWDMFKKVIFEFQIWNLIDGSLYECGLNAANFNFMIVCIGFLWIVSMLQREYCIREEIAKCNIILRWGIYYIAFFSIIVFGVYGSGYDASAFVYMQF